MSAIVSDRTDELIGRALQTKGGHLSIGRGGFTLYFDRGGTLSGYDCEPIKATCIARGRPVIDSRKVAFDAVVQLAVNGPMIAVAYRPDPAPWHAFADAPLQVVAESYRAAGAEVFNLSSCSPIPAFQPFTHRRSCHERRRERQTARINL